MIKKVLGLPLHLLRKLLGRTPAPAPTNVPSAPPPRPRPNPMPAASTPPAHEHTHDHGHGHDHDHGRPEAAAAPAPAPAATTDVRIEVGETPNPNARKFTVSITVVEKGSMSFQNAEEAAGHPLGRAIFAVPGVRGVFAVKDFVTVTRDETADWGVLTPKLMDAIRAGLAAR